MIIKTLNIDITILIVCEAHSGVELHGDIRLGNDGEILAEEDVWCPASNPRGNECRERWIVQIDTGDNGVIIK